MTLTISEIAEFVEEQVNFFAEVGQEIPKEVHISSDIIRRFFTEDYQSHISPHSLHEAHYLQFATSCGPLRILKVHNKENYIAVGGVDYVTMMAERELLHED